MRMRVLSVLRLAALVGVMMLLPSVAMAQREYSPNFSVGVRGGATLSSMAFTPEVHQSMIQGLTMGVTARYTEEKYFGLIGEVNITQRGWKEDFVRDEAPKFEYSRTLTYVQIPLLTHIYFGSRKVKGFFNLGPEVGFLINDKITANFDYNKYDAIEGFPQGYRTNEQLRMEVQNTFDYGIAGGAGIEFFYQPSQFHTTRRPILFRARQHFQGYQERLFRIVAQHLHRGDAILPFQSSLTG